MSPESIIMTKPGPYERDIRQEIINEAPKLGLTAILLGEKVLTLEEVDRIYGCYQSEEWYPQFVQYLTSGELAAFIVVGDDAVEKTVELRNIIRERYAEDRRRNAAHSPKTEEAYSENLRTIFEIFGRKV